MSNRIYQYQVPESALQPPVEVEFSVGDRVRNKDHGWVGTVRSVPQGPVIAIGKHRLGEEMSVDLDDGGTAVAAQDCWELVS